jgi:hypothetical protein
MMRPVQVLARKGQQASIAAELLQDVDVRLLQGLIAE